MLNKNERRKLISMAMTLSPLVTIGKNGFSENIVTEIEDILDAREIVKVSVLNNCEQNILDLAQAITDGCGAELVNVIGRKFTLYKRSTRKDVAHIL